ncbi:MAG TPA: hypothetical protein DG942_01595 [Ruminococcaceae bacterium]|jgi:hypothetical protein|nr:hypothetical protein [Oscillospiraceae bacterium]
MFGGKPKEEKQAEHLNEFEQQHHIENMDGKYSENIKNIVNRLIVTGPNDEGIALNSANNANQIEVAYLSALVEQNWILMKQLDQLNKSIEKLKNK